MTDDPQFRILEESMTGEGRNAAEAKRRLAARRLPKGLRDFGEAAPRFRLTPGLETSVNMALAVGAPLLVTGEPGTGKTQLAHFLKWYFDVPIFEYQVKSTSTALDMAYDFDAVAYLRESQIRVAVSPDQTAKLGPIERSVFLKPRALWSAYESPSECVLLIDEIDKAPRDFPNDLLQELDKHEFKHPFEDKWVRPVSGKPPIVVITSNGERRLPDAFLRRCIMHHIVIDEELIENIVGSHFPDLDPDLKAIALERFWEIRGLDGLRKRPSTAELLTWLAILSATSTGAASLKRAPTSETPYLNALLKDRDDLELLTR